MEKLLEQPVMSAFSKQMNTYTKPFPMTEFLSPDALYVLASLGGNTQRIPFIPFPQHLDVERGLAELTPAYIQEKELTDLAREVIVAIAWMQKSQSIVMMNEVTFFYENDALPVTVAIPNETQTKIRLAYRYKTVELLSVLGAYRWMNQKLTKDERLSCQDVVAKDIIDQFEACENFSVSMYEKQRLVYNCIFLENDGGVVKYDVERDTIEEAAGRTWLKELMQQFHMSEEFGFDDIKKRQGF